MASNHQTPTIRRILREAAEMSMNPSPDYAANPLDSDLHEWHFTLRGPPNSAYASGIYHGRIVLPPTYPLRPPSFRFVTPSGRFEVNREICLSISGHHEETWQPAWGVRTAIVALRSFMETDPKGQLGGLDAPASVRQGLALRSQAFRCSVCGHTNLEIINTCQELCESSASELPAIAIPASLKVGWRDEMKPAGPAKDQTPADGVRPVHSHDPTSASSPSSSADRPVSQAIAVSVPLASPSHQRLPNRASSATRVGQRAPQAAPVSNHDGVPVWLDRLIAGLVVLLIGRIVRMLFV